MKEITILKTNLGTETRADKVNLQKMINGNAVKTSELSGKELRLVGFVYYRETITDETSGELKKDNKVLVLLDEEGLVTGTISRTGIDKFFTFYNELGMSKEEPLILKPLFGDIKSKQGRDFLDFDLIG